MYCSWFLIYKNTEAIRIKYLEKNSTKFKHWDGMVKTGNTDKYFPLFFQFYITGMYYFLYF